MPPSIIVRDSRSVVSRKQSGFSEHEDQKWVIYDGEGGRIANDEDLAYQQRS